MPIVVRVAEVVWPNRYYLIYKKLRDNTIATITTMSDAVNWLSRKA